MADPHRIQGPSGPPEPSLPKKDRTVGPDDFKKYMVEEVKETDVDKRRHRKRREEGEEETEEEKKALGAAAPQTPAAPLKGAEAPFQAGPGKALEIPPSAEAGAPPAKATPLGAFKPEEIEQYAWEDEARMVLSQGMGAARAQAPTPPAPEEAATEEAPPPPTPTTPPSYVGGYEYEEGGGFEGYQKAPPAGVPPIEEKPRVSEKQKTPVAAAPAEIKPAAKKEAKKATPPLLAKEEKRRKGKPGEFKALMEEEKPLAVEKKKKAAAPPKKEEAPAPTRPLKPAREGVVPMEAPPKEQPLKARPEEEAPLIGALPSLKKEEPGKIPAKKPEAKEEEEAIEGVSAMPLAPAPAGAEMGGAGKEGKPREEKKPPVPQIAPPPSPMEGMTSGVIAPGAPLTSVSPYAELHPDILSLFERLVGVLTVMKTAGITETTLFLQEKTFQGTILQGTSITIREFDFAAGELNLEFSGSTQAIALLQQNLPSLSSALHRAGLTVRRAEFLFSRKEPTGGRGEGEKEQERGRGSR